MRRPKALNKGVERLLRGALPRRGKVGGRHARNVGEGRQSLSTSTHSLGDFTEHALDSSTRTLRGNTKGRESARQGNHFRSGKPCQVTGSSNVGRGLKNRRLGSDRGHTDLVDRRRQVLVLFTRCAGQLCDSTDVLSRLLDRHVSGRREHRDNLGELGDVLSGNAQLPSERTDAGNVGEVHGNVLRQVNKVVAESLQVRLHGEARRTRDRGEVLLECNADSVDSGDYTEGRRRDRREDGRHVVQRVARTGEVSLLLVVRCCDRSLRTLSLSRSLLLLEHTRLDALAVYTNTLGFLGALPRHLRSVVSPSLRQGLLLVHRREANVVTLSGTELVIVHLAKTDRVALVSSDLRVRRLHLISGLASGLPGSRKRPLHLIERCSDLSRILFDAFQHRFDALAPGKELTNVKSKFSVCAKVVAHYASFIRKLLQLHCIKTRSCRSLVVLAVQ